MTEIPEHLLRRSRERRAALGQGGGDGDGAAEAPSAAPATTEGGGAPAAATARTPAASTPAKAPAVIEEAEPKWVEPTLPPGRARIPIFAMPVLLVLPFFAFFYAHAFGTPAEEVPSDPLVLGAQVFRSSGCSGCHGAAGEGGTGPALQGGAAKLTFPDEQEHIDWVKNGSGPSQGKSYGDPNREGGPAAPATGAMPAFQGQLSEEEIQAVVAYEREQL